MESFTLSQNKTYERVYQSKIIVGVFRHVFCTKYLPQLTHVGSYHTRVSLCNYASLLMHQKSLHTCFSTVYPYALMHEDKYIGHRRILRLE